MQTTNTSVHSLLDPRTKLILVITIATIMIGGSNLGVFGWGKHILSAIPFILFLLERRVKTAMIYGILYSIACLCEFYLLSSTEGILNFILVTFLIVFTRMMPGYSMAYYMVTTTTVSSFMAAMEKAHVPQSITIPLTVTFRFFPTIMEEHAAIKKAMSVRGVRFGGGKPLQMLEYRMVPLLISCMNVCDELSAASLTRGLGSPKKRTNILELKMNILDYLALLVSVFCWCMFFWDLIGG